MRLGGFWRTQTRPHYDMTVIGVDQERDYFLRFGRQVTERLPKIADDPAPDLVLTVWDRWVEKTAERGSH